MYLKQATKQKVRREKKQIHSENFTFKFTGK